MKTLIFIMLLCSCNAWAVLDYQAKRVDVLPLIDGTGNDEQWQQAQNVVVKDAVAGHKLHFSALHDGVSIAVKIQFPDATENREHKTLLWNDKSSSYKTGPKREDTLLLKWAISPLAKDLTLSSNEPYLADIWFWKSFRTDPMGYADDKYQIYSKVANKKANRFRSKNGSLFFLQRRGDNGKSAYQTRILSGKHGDTEQKYSHRQPEGSRADIKAKGIWRDGVWTVEFLRKLNTGYSNDIILNTETAVLLGLSRYEIAGRKPDTNLEIPLYGSGEVGELIKFHLEK